MWNTSSNEVAQRANQFHQTRMTQASPSDATWEELYDSGQLDQQMAQLNFGGTQQSVQRSQHGPHQGLIMRPLLPEQPRQPALILPTTHHVIKTPGQHSMAVFGGNLSAIPPPNNVSTFNGLPQQATIMPQNGYRHNNPHMSFPSNIHANRSDLPLEAQNGIKMTGNTVNVQTSHDLNPRPLMSIVPQAPIGYQQMNQISQNHQNIMNSQETNQSQNRMHLPTAISQGPQHLMQNNALASRAPFQSPPPVRIGATEGHYQPMPYHGLQGPMVLPGIPPESRPILPIPIDMSVPPPRIPINGNGATRPYKTYYQNGFAPNAPQNKIQAQKSSKNKNSKNNFNVKANTQTKPKASPIQPVFPTSDTTIDQLSSEAAAAAYNAVRVESDYPRTLYRPPEPKVTILKRPVSTPSNLSMQAGGSSDNSDEGGNVANSAGINSNRTKSLKQREEEYAQARLRILGSTEPEVSTGPLNVSSSDNSATITSQSTPNVNLVQQKSSGKNISTGTSLSALSNGSSVNSKQILPNNHSNEIPYKSRDIDVSSGINVGQGSES